MSRISKVLLILSFTLLFVNGSAFTFIIFNERIGTFFGYALFIFTSLVGAVLASIADENDQKARFYCKVSMYSNLVTAFIPFYYHFVANTFFPSLLALAL